MPRTPRTVDPGCPNNAACPTCLHVDDVADLCDECADALCDELISEYGLPHEIFPYVRT